MNTEDNKKDKRIFSQAIITSTTLLSSVLEAILGYIAVYFFAPIWQKIMKAIKTKDEQKNENEID